VGAAALATHPLLDRGCDGFSKESGGEPDDPSEGSVSEALATATRPDTECGTGGDENGNDVPGRRLLENQSDHAIARVAKS
jgi:hypothetical protein